ncbi:hypothetical protein VTK73DRAFT_5752 [Phialemonium thermophilum]|uniref:DUF6590 domain-containing protein n=1 Tax=Phialemonium thermophilum TaxID=223376 RepID=A0ABR3WMF4_9PEZI
MGIQRRHEAIHASHDSLQRGDYCRPPESQHIGGERQTDSTSRDFYGSRSPEKRPYATSGPSRSSSSSGSSYSSRSDSGPAGSGTSSVSSWSEVSSETKSKALRQASQGPEGESTAEDGESDLEDGEIRPEENGKSGPHDGKSGRKDGESRISKPQREVQTWQSAPREPRGADRSPEKRAPPPPQSSQRIRQGLQLARKPLAPHHYGARRHFQEAKAHAREDRYSHTRYQQHNYSPVAAPGKLAGNPMAQRVAANKRIIMEQLVRAGRAKSFVRRTDTPVDAGQYFAGLVFSTAFHSPSTNLDVDLELDTNLTPSAFGTVHSKFRKMVVLRVAPDRMTCTALPIYTNNGNGLRFKKDRHEWLAIRDVADPAPAPPENDNGLIYAKRDASWSEEGRKGMFLAGLSNVHLTELTEHRLHLPVTVEGVLCKGMLPHLCELTKKVHAARLDDWKNGFSSEVLDNKPSWTT